MESVKIILLCISAALVYGICHDQITARVCVEYFTIGHPPIFGGTKNPTLLAFGWGVFATWWVGALLGLPAALLARIGSRPRLGWRDMVIPIAMLMAVVAISATIGGLIGLWFTGPFNANYFPEQGIQSTVPYSVAAGAHESAYAAGLIGGVLIWGWIWWRRERLARLEQTRKELRSIGL